MYGSRLVILIAREPLRVCGVDLRTAGAKIHTGQDLQTGRRRPLADLTEDVRGHAFNHPVICGRCWVERSQSAAVDHHRIRMISQREVDELSSVIIWGVTCPKDGLNHTKRLLIPLASLVSHSSPCLDYLMPVVAMPRIRYFCRKRKKSTMGINESIDIANISPQSMAPPWESNSAFKATGAVYILV